MERKQGAAVQEAAFYRAKLLAFENSQTDDVIRMERQRIAELERQVSSLAKERSEQDKQIAEMGSLLALKTQVAEQPGQCASAAGLQGKVSLLYLNASMRYKSSDNQLAAYKDM